ncbi:hypothetical protein PG997_011619 [Apiospora hydei]|uniref:Zn(2)-C6 fungal-type domain-containing protein n=1 Tax=Apiospora hydei TaxID=1337664 RepID=A0ABR1VJJ3_9PEZI
MVTPACYTSSETSRRYSRACPPYPLGYLERRYPHHHHLPSHHDSRLSKTMVERDMDDAPRKRIAVACGRCRKRKIRCSGDPGNGGPCSNCKNAGHEPCLFLRVSSTETHLRDGSADYGYNVETARAYHARSSGGSLSPLAAFNAAAALADGGVAGAAYRQNSYPGYATGGKGYYSTTAWTGGAYPDDGGVAAAAEYGLGGYPAYPTTAAQLGQDPAEQLYRYGSSASSKAAGSVYVDPADAAAASTYPYGSLVHRPAGAGAAATAAAVAAAVSSSELPNFSLSSMAASLPSSHANNGSSTTSDRLPNPHRTLSSSSSKTSTSTGDVSTYGGDFGDSPASYSTGASSSATLSGRSISTQYSTGTPTAATTEYGAADHAGGSYIYTDNKVSTGSPLTSPSRRGSHAAAALANGHDYVPVSHSHVPQTHPSYGGGGSGHDHYDVHHHHHHHHPHHRAQHHPHHQQDYDDGATTAGTGSGATSDGHGGRHHLRR